MTQPPPLKLHQSSRQPMRPATILIRIGICLTVLALLFAGIIFLSVNRFNAYGKKTLEKTLNELKEQNIPVAFRDTVQEPVPDELNFCASPPLKDITKVEGPEVNPSVPEERRVALKALGYRQDVTGSKQTTPGYHGGAPLGRRADLREWADYLQDLHPLPADEKDPTPAQRITRILSRDDPYVDELSKTLARPMAQWTSSWKTNELPAILYALKVPYLSTLQGASSGLMLRSIAATQAGDFRKAHQAALITTRFAQATSKEPFLIALIVAATQSASASQEVWELCLAHGGSPAEFDALQIQLSKINLEEANWQVLQSELAGSLQSMKVVKADPARDSIIKNIGSGGGGEVSPVSSAALMAIPDGWYDLNTSNLAKLQLEYLIKPAQQGDWKIIMQKGEAVRQLLKPSPGAIPNLGNIFAGLMLPTLSLISPKVGHAQCLLNQAVIACALESYYATHKEYPQTLSSVRLVDGSPLPLDVITRRPIGYRRTDNGRYALWCVGFDGKDDDGWRNLNQEEPEKTKFTNLQYEGDWVWDFPIP